MKNQGTGYKRHLPGKRVNNPKSRKIEYPRILCKQCSKICSWQSVNGLCWDCTLIQVGIKRIIAGENLRTLEAQLRMPSSPVEETDADIK